MSRSNVPPVPMMPRFRPLIVAAMLPAAFLSTRAADASQLFFIPASSGYGISECLAPGAVCGKVVADSWCESKGYGPAIAYGRAEDITATIPTELKKVRAIETDSFVIKCSD